jgi:hypothetical protein
VRDLPIRLCARCLAATIAIVLPAGEAAWADCTPAAADSESVICTGTATNLGGAASGTTGYGTGSETGVTVKAREGQVGLFRD